MTQQKAGDMDAKKGLILCVDDEPNILRSLFWLLKRDFEVITAPSGQAALELVRQHDFDVIISDQRMPSMTGVELLREVRQIAPRAMRILLTGYSDIQAVMRSVNESEVFRFINKPWHINDLPKIVEEAAQIARAHPAPAPVPAVNEFTPVASQTETLLVIDDSAEVPAMVREVVGTRMNIVHAASVPAAVARFAQGEIGLVVADTTVAGVDTTRLLKMVKLQFPGVVTVVLTRDVDSGDIITLINQGQIYRFIPKPIKPGFLRLVLTSAMLKFQQLKTSPTQVERYRVEALSEAERQSLMSELAEAAAPVHDAAADHAGPDAGSWVHRLGLGVRRLFGRA